jgi:hypothetical protein
LADGSGKQGDGYHTMKAGRRRRLRDREPIVTLLVCLLITVMIILIWGIDRIGPDRVPPATNLEVADRVFNWEGGMCLDLETWNGSEWHRVASTHVNDAANGEWGKASSGERFCEAAYVMTTDLRLPPDLESGTHRVCDYGPDRRCWEFLY